MRSTILACSIACLPLMLQALPKMELEQTVFDFGVLISGKTYQRTFTLQNTGDEPLVISRFASSWGGAAPIWTQQPIGPGEQVQVGVHINLNNYVAGRQQKSITICSNDPDAPTQIVRYKFWVDDDRCGIPRATCRSTRHDFRKVAAGDSLATKFTVWNTGRLALKLEIDSLPDGCSVQLSQKHVTAGQTCLVEVATSVKTRDKLDESITIKTNDPHHPYLTFRLFAILSKNGVDDQ